LGLVGMGNSEAESIRGLRKVGTATGFESSWGRLYNWEGGPTGPWIEINVKQDSGLPYPPFTPSTLLLSLGGPHRQGTALGTPCISPIESITPNAVL
jgi:hypothetical protein